LTGKVNGLGLATEGGGLLFSNLLDREITGIMEDPTPPLAKIGD